MITVICTCGRAGNGFALSAGDEWTIDEAHAASVIAAGQAKLKNPEDAARLPKLDVVAPGSQAAAAAAPEGDADEFDDSDALTGDEPADGPKTALGKSKAKRDKKAADDGAAK